MGLRWSLIKWNIPAAEDHNLFLVFVVVWNCCPCSLNWTWICGRFWKQFSNSFGTLWKWLSCGLDLNCFELPWNWCSCLGQVLQLDLSSFCVFLVRAMWLLDLLVVLIVVLLVMLVAFWYYFRKMVMMLNQKGHSAQPLKRSTRNSGTQTSWEDQIFYMNPQGRGVIHQDHCSYLSKERGRCKELHLCQLCFKRWCVSPDSICGSLRKRMLQDSSWSLGDSFPKSLGYAKSSATKIRLIT